MVFESLLYRIEHHVAPIPKVHKAPNRRVLAEHPLADTPATTVDHSGWDRVLKRHVTSGGKVSGITGVHVVDYEGVAADPDFDAYLKELADADVAALQPAEDLALWINAYNALCVNHIVRHVRAKPEEPLASILHLKKGSTPVWDQEAGVVGGQGVSLNQIEHEMLRKRWNEPLVHASIVCASASCPNLRREAFVPERLAEQMLDSFREWMSNPTKGAVRQPSGTVVLSRIFLWFADDFGGFAGGRKFVRDHGNVPDDLHKALSSTLSATRYFRYDWSTNAKS